MIPVEAFHIAQIIKAQFETPCFFFLCQRHKPLRDKRTLMAQLGLITIVALADSKGRIAARVQSRVSETAH